MADNIVSMLITEMMEEDFSGGIQESFPKLDDVFPMLYTTAMGVESQGVGRDSLTDPDTYGVIHTFEMGVSGAFKWAPLGGASLTAYATTMTEYPGDSTIAFPGMDEQAGPRLIQKRINLAKGLGNVFLPAEMIQADQLSASQASMVALYLKGLARNAALAEIQCWYAMDAMQAIAILSENPAVSLRRATADTMTAGVVGPAINQLRPGMFVDIFDASGATKRNTGLAMIDGVRMLPSSGDVGGYGEVVIQSMKGTPDNWTTQAVVATDIICRADSRPTGSASEGYGPKGPAYWMGTTGTKFGIDIAAYPQFQSVVVAAAGATLTDSFLNRYLGRLIKAYGKDNCPESILTSYGVTAQYQENFDGLSRFERMGRALQISGGWEFGAVPFTYNGVNFRWIISTYMPSESSITAAAQTGGHLWAMKLRDQNVMRYVIPKIPQSKSMEPVASEIEFLYPLGVGPKGMFMPYLNSAARATNVMQAPFWRHVAIAPKFLPGLKVTGLAELL